MLRVLSVDGGGIRGIIPATVLMKLEELSGKPIADLFDLFVGTSTGGILALGLTCPQPDGTTRKATAMRDLYLVRGATIFPLGGLPYLGPPKSSWLFGDRPPLPADASVTDRLKHFIGNENVGRTFAPLGGGAGHGNARYSAEPLKKELEAQVGATLMSKALRPVVVVSCDLATQAPLLFCGGGLDQGTLGDATICTAALATSAGPTFFPSVHYRDRQGDMHECVDGGLVANDPALIGYIQALSMLGKAGQSGDDVLIVSLGTGLGPTGEPPEVHDLMQLVDQSTWLHLGPRLIGAMSSAGGELMRQQLQQGLGDRYVRLQTSLGFGAVHGMDDAQSINLEALRLTGERLVEKSKPILERLVSLLGS